MRYRELAQLIRTGGDNRKQARLKLFERSGDVCALGAMGVALQVEYPRLSEPEREENYKALYKRVLADTGIDLQREMLAYEGQAKSLAAIIMDLNDWCQYDFDEIADLLDQF